MWVVCGLFPFLLRSYVRVWPVSGLPPPFFVPYSAGEIHTPVVVSSKYKYIPVVIGTRTHGGGVRFHTHVSFLRHLLFFVFLFISCKLQRWRLFYFILPKSIFLLQMSWFFGFAAVGIGISIRYRYWVTGYSMETVVYAGEDALIGAVGIGYSRIAALPVFFSFFLLSLSPKP